MKKLLTAIVLMAAGLSATAQNSAIDNANRALEKSDWKGALAILKAAEENPKTTKLADLYSKIGACNYAIAYTELMKAAQNQPFDTLTYCTAIDQASEYFGKSENEVANPTTKAKADPETPKSNHENMMNLIMYYFYAGDFLNRSGRTDMAAQYFERFIDMPRNPIFTDFERDSVYQAKEAVFAQAAYNATYLRYTEKDWAGVLKHADMALKNPQFAHDIYVMKISAIDQTLGDESAEYEATIKAAFAATGDEKYLNELIRLAMHKTKNADGTQNKEQAVAMADKLIAEYPGNKMTYFMKGTMLLDQPPYDYEGARACFTKALEIDPNYLEANASLGNSYFNELQDRINSGEIVIPSGQGDDVVKAKNKVMREQVYPFYNKCIPYYEKCRELAPDEPAKWIEGLFRSYFEMRMFEKAKDLIVAYGTYAPQFKFEMNVLGQDNLYPELKQMFPEAYQ